MSLRSVSTEPVPHPPKPRLTLRVAVIGHRPKPEKFPESSFDFVRQRLDDVFGTIIESLKTSLERNKGYYEPEPPKVRLVSGLAEGADQLALEMRPVEWEVDAILPFPLDRYRQDFEQSANGTNLDVRDQLDKSLASASTILQLPEDWLDQSNDPSSYSYARDLAFFIRQFDVLVSVWDGKPEDGPGGTAQIVRTALDSNIPIVWVSSQVDTFPRIVQEVAENGLPFAPPADCLRGGLQEAISTVVSAPTDEQRSPVEHPTGLSAKDRLTAFFNEAWPDGSSWTTYDRFKRWLQGLPRRPKIVPDTIEDVKVAWTKFTEDEPIAGDLTDRLFKTLIPRFAWADALAVDLSNRYRSAYIKAYLMAAAAVIMALLGFLIHDLSAPPLDILLFKFILLALEFYWILRILMIVKKGKQSRWQERWIEYRALAEILRDLRFLAYLGEYGYIQTPDDMEPSSSAWFLWYVRATIRELGLPNAVLDGAYQRAHLVAVEKNVVQDQIKYHEENAKILSKMHHVLSKAGEYCFWLTLIILCCFLLAHLCAIVSTWSVIGNEVPVAPGHVSSFEMILLYLSNPVTFLVASLPAIGAAMAGIRETGDFEGFAQRSAKTLAELVELKREFDVAKRRLRLESTGAVLLSTARVLTADLAAWQSIYGRKRLSLPT
jgi:hypothetical protein